MTRKTLIPVLLTAAILAASSCIEPILHLRQSMEVLVKVLWKVDVYPEGEKPNGVTLYFFREGMFYMKHTTSQVDSCVVQLEPGRYRLYMISQSPEEYWKMDFKDMDDFDNARVSVTETKSSWYSTRSESEVVITNPEVMVAGVSDFFDVTEDMIERQRLAATKSEDNTNIHYYTILVPVNPRSIVSQYWVTIYSDNIDMLKAVRASTTGMARTFELTKDKTNEEEGTQLISEWSLTVDDEEHLIGHLDGKVTTFGFPNGELPNSDRDSTLNVSTLLVDNKTVENYKFYVGDKIKLEDNPPKGYRHLYHITFGSIFEPAIHPERVLPEGGSGFTAGVTDWEEEKNVEVEI